MNLMDAGIKPEHCVLSASHVWTIKKKMLLSELNKTVVLRKSNTPSNN